MNNFISNLFLDGGISLKLDEYESARAISLIKDNFKKYGIVVLENFILKPEKLIDYTNHFTIRYSNDAQRRVEKFGKKNIKSVDVGNHQIPLHSESSFSPTCPEIMWFYCLENNLANGTPTTICDGVKVWEAIPLELKRKFLSEPIVYKVEAEVPIKKNNQPREWYIESIGVKEPIINLAEGKLSFFYKKYAINNIRYINRISFCNHILSIFDEKQILDAYMDSDKKFLKNNYKFLEDLTEKFTYEFKWKKNQLLIIDNERFMHGRRAIKKNEKRDIINIQTLISNF
jgi:alpha-ketoglutarate-dependent taurine dioxygenase